MTLTQISLLRMSEVIKRSGLSRSTIYRMIERGEFPRVIPLTSRSVAWSSSELDKWIDERLAGSRGENDGVWCWPFSGLKSMNARPAGGSGTMKYQALKRFVLWAHCHGLLPGRLVEFLFAKVRGLRGA